jgi:adenylyltransferase/sulfurtransferase
MSIDRYHRQSLLPQLGKAAVQRLSRSRVLVVGCGAIGSSACEMLARAGVGFLHVVDRDIVELHNLQRQNLFDEADARDELPKAIAAERRLKKINSEIEIRASVIDVDASRIEKLADEVDLLVDGTDNVATRYLINDVAIKQNIPWIYGACVGTEGRVMTIRPGKTACLRCVFPSPPNPRELPTCDSAGVLGPAATVVGSLQATAAIKLLSGDLDAIEQSLLTFDLWSNRFHPTNLVDARRGDCPACAMHRFEFLEAARQLEPAKLCGRDVVQISDAAKGMTLPVVAERLRSAGVVQQLPYMVRCSLPDDRMKLTVFEDGRLLVHGTSDIGRAKSIAARCIGS